MSEAGKARIAAHFDAKRGAREVGIPVKEYKEAERIGRLISGYDTELRDRYIGLMTLSDTGWQVAFAFEDEHRKIRAREGYVPPRP